MVTLEPCPRLSLHSLSQAHACSDTPLQIRPSRDSPFQVHAQVEAQLATAVAGTSPSESFAVQLIGAEEEEFPFSLCVTPSYGPSGAVNGTSFIGLVRVVIPERRMTLEEAWAMLAQAMRMQVPLGLSMIFIMWSFSSYLDLVVKPAESVHCCHGPFICLPFWVSCQLTCCASSCACFRWINKFTIVSKISSGRKTS